MRVALIDADIIVYRVASMAEGKDPFDGSPRKDITYDMCKEQILAEVESLRDIVGATQFVMVFSPDSRTNFRKAVAADYKANRNPKPKPEKYWPLVKWVRTVMPCTSIEGMEGDDLLGIMHTREPEGTIIISSDKDMKTIPGRTYNHVRGELYEISVNEANHYWMLQTLMGDSTDGYSGCPGIGAVKAARALPDPDGSDSQQFMNRLWHEVLELYRDRYQNELVAFEKALQQARLARILRYKDYCYETDSILLWHPYEQVRMPLNQAK